MLARSISSNAGESPDPQSVPQIENPGQSSSPKKSKIPYIFLFAAISLNDGMAIGYKASLIGILTERGIPSEQRSLLTLVTLTFVLRMFLAPLADKYYVPLVGKRRTYLIPCKLFAATSYYSASFFIDSWIDHKHIGTIALYFFLSNMIMMFENNALQGFRMDFFGRSNSGSAGAAQTMGIILGIGIGLQGFTCLNSKWIMLNYFGVDHSLISHGDFFQYIAIANLLAILVVFCIPDNFKPAKSQIFFATPWRVIKAIFKSRILFTAVLWNALAPTMAMGMKMTVGQYYIKKGFRREDYVIIIAMSLMPVHLVVNLICIRIVKGGKLAFKLWIAILNGAAVECLHAINHHYFDKETNYRRTAVCIGLIMVLDSLANWMMIQTAFFMTVSSKKYTVSFLSTIYSSFAAMRSMPLMLMNAGVDHFSMLHYFVGCLILQLLYNLLTYSIVKQIDSHDYRQIGKEFEYYLETEEVDSESRKLTYEPYMIPNSPHSSVIV